MTISNVDDQPNPIGVSDKLVTVRDGEYLKVFALRLMPENPPPTVELLSTADLLNWHCDLNRFVTGRE
jgi:hypothetical protein